MLFLQCWLVQALDLLGREWIFYFVLFMNVCMYVCVLDDKNNEICLSIF